MGTRRRARGHAGTKTASTGYGGWFARLCEFVKGTEINRSKRLRNRIFECVEIPRLRL